MSEIAPPFDWSTVSSEFGARPLYGYHNGIDFAVRRGSEIRTPLGGVVVEEGWSASLGWFIRIRHRDANPRLSTGYAHMIERSHLRVGATVSARDVVGRVNNTGYSFGDHLHHETWRDGVRVNPRGWYAEVGGIFMPIAPVPAGSAPAADNRRWIDLTGWYWYTSPGEAQAMRNPRKPLLEGRYPIVGSDANGAVQVLSNSRGRIWVHSSAVGAAPIVRPTGLIGRELDLNSWYWYRSAAEARAMRNPQGKGRGQIMLSGRGYKVLAEDGGALQVHSRSMGTVWLHPDARHRVI
ncbi:hypothetical protein A9Z40_03180 [Microbacterium arborescens]|uniref:M23ase beta-sheet core domain-containing protein n=1 Tax=Microbacterium arborescens TaxID=33883 RepID=A0ABX2WIS8_9MICO|nr:M23 family metallopeptidase [Microbacterium arborescens]OAZ40958.1 hypothetical protein A9Z40_03180 [Microbacterium arborescens]